MAKDPYHYFRIEAREHVDGLSAGILELEKRTDDREVVARLLRHAHTLKGAARVVRQPDISELSHRIEELLGPIREGQAAAGREDINQLLHLVDSISDYLKTLEEPDPVISPDVDAEHERPRRASAEASAVNLDAVRIEISELDPLLYGIWEASINLEALRDQTTVLDRLIGEAHTLVEETQTSRSEAAESTASASTRVSSMSENFYASLSEFRQSLIAISDRTGRELLELQDRALQLRLLPASSVFPSLERAARDAADALGKQVDFVAAGGENRLDAHVLRALHDALLHLVRNAVSHGVEKPDQRTAAGKPAAGRVEVNVERRASRMTFVCRDDGQGVDVERVRRAAVERGFMSAAEGKNLSSDQAMQFLFRGGISTAAAVTEHSGRGVGLDVVRDTADRLKGTVEMRSSPSTGTTVELSVPISLESMPVLELEVAGQRTAVPFDSVRRILLVPDDEIARSAAGDTIVVEGAQVPLLSLRSLLFSKAPPARSVGPQRVVVIEAGGTWAGIAIDRPLGRSVVILKPLPSTVGRLNLVMGACLDAAGNPQTVLDTAHLVQAAYESTPGVVPAEQPTSPRILVVDDSLTSRMLEQSILETAGYEVDAVVSGEEALERVKQQTYALFVVDVEMPGISGYEFVARTKADPDLRQIPAILVTSRAAPEDKARGESVGAAAYIVKGEFEEAGFLRTIRRLIESQS